MIYAFLIILSTFAFLTSVPIVAMCEMHEIEVSPLQRCGPACVIETSGFDTLQEAADFNRHIHGEGHIYRIKDSNLWFVDYQVTENEADIKVVSTMSEK